MERFKLPSDRVINSTDNNEYSEGMRDETLWEDDLVDVDIPFDDIIPDSVDENGEGDRPLYDEEGYRHATK